MRGLLQVYFGRQGRERKDFLLQHPEIQAYFDLRKVERDNERLTGETFAQADPRLARFWELARVDITLAGTHVAESLQRRRHARHPGLELRRERRA